ncbi:Oidioi.mRNA.OKI2018_I69.chr1.g137.t1.cds [Oikopleura dioica]|uniref:Oidioi.mRNA.OKI2018_I69.chr1.g137.t1.cds n=1 Tax=Oikopleura dioica TaxID=34765 RepID=A0ABN7SP37_OIKDI|nr:Oidioi.mRNA.OKI2018_I69.chr1.g137.t1.cds [Oikopleura dioica]
MKIIAVLLGIVFSRDFTEADIVHIYKRVLPYADAFRCFTCENAVDNYECNNHAPDIFCPAETEFCFTEHVFSGETDSIRVRKSCMTRNKCHQEQLGCHTDPITGLTTCKECCEGEICNLAVPKSNERFEEMLIEIGFNSARNFFSTIVVFITALFLL